MKTKLQIPNNYRKAMPGELKPNMKYWLSTDGRANHFRNIASTYGDSKEYTNFIDLKVKEGTLYIEK